jgi:hypothetical protein
MKITADIIISTGLVVALILCIIFDRPNDVVTNISVGLVGFLSKVVYTEAKPEKKEEKQNESI